MIDSVTQNEKKLALSHQSKQIIDEICKKHGFAPKFVVMRKLKCSNAMASVIEEITTSDNTLYVAAEEK